MKSFWTLIGHTSTLACSVNLFLAVVLLMEHQPGPSLTCIFGAICGFVGAWSAFAQADRHP